ncbi:MAG: outer membrane protein assembly factor BamD, partial [Alphaproteobacteria bacterium]|nr:outer membrane protein assembly factor BamD [Alphaproteobacteria bacterium]
MRFLKKSRLIFFAAGTAAVLLLSSCAGKTALDPETTPPEVLYNHALDLLTKEHEYTKAISAFDEIDRYYPYSRWALRAQIMLAFTYYIKREYD